MTLRTWPAAGLLLLTLVAACGDDDAPDGPGAAPTTPAATTPAPGGSGTTLTVVGNDDLEFVPDELRAPAGRISLTLDVDGRVPHDLVVDGIEGARLDRVDGGERETLTFAATPGTYTLICTFHSGMRGTLVVTP